MIVDVEKRLSLFEDHQCKICKSEKEKFYFLCLVSDKEESMIICGQCLYYMSLEIEKFSIHSSPDAVGIGEKGIINFLKNFYEKEKEPTLKNWKFANAILLPHPETNQDETPHGEWVFTAVTDSNGKVLLKDKNASMGIYPNKETTEEEIRPYLIKNHGAKEVRFEYIKIDNANWVEVKNLLLLDQKLGLGL